MLCSGYHRSQIDHDIHLSAADPVVKPHLLQSYCLSELVLPFGSSHVLPFTQSRSLLTTYMYSDASGIFHAIATPEFNTLLLACPVCLMLSFLGQHPFCHQPSPALLSLFGRFLVNLACWRTPILGVMPCLVAYMPSNTTRRMGCVRQSSVTSVCLGPSRTMILMR